MGAAPPARVRAVRARAEVAAATGEMRGRLASTHPHPPAPNTSSGPARRPLRPRHVSANWATTAFGGCQSHDYLMGSSARPMRWPTIVP